MPAYNSSRTIRESLDGLLAQTYADFELIVSDNASTDDTAAIVLDYARRDRRVRLIRQPRNIGANGNYAAVVRESRGTYFKWASSNDWCAPGFLEACVRVLEARPDVVVAAPRTRLFDGDLSEATDYPDDPQADADDPIARFLHVIATLKLNNVINGVIRMSALRQTKLIEHYPGSDVVLVAHLALLGKLVLVAEPMFYRRMDRATATRLMSEADVHRHHYPRPTLRSLFPSWRWHVGWFRIAASAPLRPSERARALHIALKLCNWNRRDLLRDLAVVARPPR